MRPRFRSFVLPTLCAGIAMARVAAAQTFDGPSPTSGSEATVGVPMTKERAVSVRDQQSLIAIGHDKRPRLQPGFGLNVFGAAGSKDAAAWGLGARLELVMPFGLVVGGSYQQSFNRTADEATVRPLLGEVGVAIPVARHVEVRPMVGLGYAFVTSSGTNTNTSSVPVAAAGLDVAPGAKLSFLLGEDAAAFEVYTLPKYHFITGSNFFGMELGAGARF
jgi:hypothetical protein